MALLHGQVINTRGSGSGVGDGHQRTGPQLDGVSKIEPIGAVVDRDHKLLPQPAGRDIVSGVGIVFGLCGEGGHLRGNRFYHELANPTTSRFHSPFDIVIVDRVSIGAAVGSSVCRQAGSERVPTIRLRDPVEGRATRMSPQRSRPMISVASSVMLQPAAQIGRLIACARSWMSTAAISEMTERRRNVSTLSLRIGASGSGPACT
jgi:hypothetical protein